MSREAIAAALARDDLPSGERLVVFSLASFAGSDNRAWPGAAAAAARAGLSRSRYLYDRDRLVRRGLVVVEKAASGRGRASTVALPFATEGPWWEGEINAELFEVVLSRSRARGPARLVLAAMAALADDSGIVRGLSGVELCAAACVDDHSYRRARKELLDSGELVLVHRACGRGNTNVWEVRPPGVVAAATRDGRRPQRVAPPATARPLLAALAGPSADEIDADGSALADLVGRPDGGGGPTVGAENRPVSEPNGGQDRTLFDSQPVENPAETGAENPAETPAANARAGREPQNPGIPRDPPTPLAGGQSPRSMMIEQTFITDRGRRRRRMVPVDVDAVRRGLGIPTAEDRRDWAGVAGAALGPVAGGLLTSAFSWRAIFVVQIPVVLLALRAAIALRGRVLRRGSSLDTSPDRPHRLANVALALLSAALTAALFLLVLLLVDGWRRSPAVAALAAGPLFRGVRAGTRSEAVAGSVLIAGGLAGLALLPGAELAWTIAPQVLVGLGLGLSVDSLTTAALRDRIPRALHGGWTIAARHAGVVVGLAILTPIFTADLRHAETPAKEAIASLVLDAPLPASTKLDLADQLGRRLVAERGRVPDLRPAFTTLRVPATQAATAAALELALEDQLKRAATRAFRTAFLVAAALALLALAPALALSDRSRS